MNLNNILQSQELKDAVPYLLAGGAGAVAGGAATSRRRDESRAAYTARVLRNALLAGGMAAGGTYAVGKGLQKTVGSVDKDNPLSGKADNEGPGASLLKGIAFHPATATLAGAVGLGATSGAKGLLGNDKARTESALKALSGLTGQSEAALQELSPDRIRDLTTAPNTANLSAGEVNKLRQSAGLGSSYNRSGGVGGHIDRAAGKLGDLTRGVLSKGNLSKFTREFGKTFGNTAPTRLRRGGIGAVSALLPALVGAALTSDEK